MQLMLKDDEVRLLRDTIRDHLPDLRRQTAATDIGSRDMKHELTRRLELCERVLGELERAASAKGA